MWRRRRDDLGARVLSDARRAAGEGRCLDAIDALQTLDGPLVDPEVEEWMVRLRHDAFPELAGATGRPEWPASFPDRRRPGPTGLPEATPDELTGDLIGGAITHHGALRVNGLLDEGQVAELIAAIDQAFAARDRWLEDEATPTPPWFVPFVPNDPAIAAALSRSFAVEAGAVWTADSPRVLHQLLQTYDHIGLRRAAEEYLGERPAISVRKCTLRRVPPDLERAAWHQDGAFLGPQVRSLNVWLALSRCGGSSGAPGLELVPRRMDRVLDTGTTGTYLPWAVSPVLVDELVESTGTPTVRPEFAPGDALLFDDRFLHRTGVADDLTQPRYAVETWLFAPSTYPARQIPLVY